VRWKVALQIAFVLFLVNSAFCAKALSPEALVKKGYAYMQSGKLDDAKDCFMQALENAPEASDAAKGLAQVFIKKGEVEEGASYFKELIKKDPQNAVAHFGLGYLNLLRGERFYDDAASSFKIALLSEPHLEDAYICLASIYFHRRLYGQAAELLERALFMLPSSDAIYTQLWYSYYKLWDECCKGGDKEGAKFAFSKLQGLPKLREQARLGIAPPPQATVPEKQPAPPPAEEAAEAEKEKAPKEKTEEKEVELPHQKAPEEAPAKEEATKAPATPPEVSPEKAPEKVEGIEGLVVSFADGVGGVVLGKGLLDESKNWEVEIFTKEKSLGKFPVTKTYSSTLSITAPTPLQKGDAITILTKLAIHDGDEGVIREIFSQGFANVDITKNIYLRGKVKTLARRAGEKLFESEDVQIQSISVVIEFSYPDNLPPLSSGMRVVFHAKGAQGEGGGK